MADAIQPGEAEEGIQVVQDEKGPIDYKQFGDADLHDKVLVSEARQANTNEHKLGFFAAFRTYKRSALWAVLMSSSIIMEGYDTTLIGSFMAYPAFQQKYGTYTEASGWQISAPWQSGFNAIGAIGNIIGALLNGYLTARFGHRRVLMFFLTWLAIFVFMAFFAPTIEVQFVAQFMLNIPWGAFATTGPAYAAEVTPLALRGYMTAYINLCWCTGQFISAGVLKGLNTNTTEWSYKIPFAIQWAWPIPLFIAAWLAPESPWFLVRTGKMDEARKSLERLSEKDHDVDYDAALALMVHTDKMEKEERTGITYWDCFRGTNLRRTEIACVSFISQVTDGGTLAYSGTYFYEQTGIGANTSFALNLVGTAIAFCGVIVSWFLLPRFGRRTIFLWGFYMLISCLYIIAILGCVPNPATSIAWAQAILCIVWLGSYSMSVGPIVYTIVAEIGATRLRTQTVVLGRSAYYVTNLIGGIIEPYFINPTAWNAKGKTAFFWGTLSALTTLWAWLRLPETKDRTFNELDVMFQKKVPSRKFATYEIDADEEFMAH